MVNIKGDVRAVQRQEGFRGGIQAGTSATSVSSSSLEKIVRKTILLYNQDGYRSGLSGAEYKKKLGSSLESPAGGMYPDGGMWFEGDELLACLECKFQGRNGNAIERWNKNAAMAQSLNVKRYITFCSGEGFFPGGTSERIITSSYLAWNPTGKKVWEDLDGVWGFYRFKTIEEAELRIPTILHSELMKLGISLKGSMNEAV